MFKIYKAAADLTKGELEEALQQAIKKEQAEANAEHSHDHGHDEKNDGHAKCADDCCGHDHADGSEHGHHEVKEHPHGDHAHDH